MAGNRIVSAVVVHSSSNQVRLICLSRSSPFCVLLAWLTFASFLASAQSKPTLPQGGSFSAGAGAIGPASNGSLNITQSSARGIIDWKSFSIGAGGQVLIKNGSGATLSRVNGGELSRIDGLLKATGSVYLINPNGVIVGANGCVSVGDSFVASTRNIAPDAFMAGGLLTAAGTSPGNVVNRGVIQARLGDVILLGSSVDNAGTLRAPKGTATLATGNRVLLTTVGGPAGVYVAPDASARGSLTQTGRIDAAAAALKAAGGDIYTLAGNRSGLISATGSKTINGEVWLSAPNGKVVAGGNISARNADGTGGRIVANGAEISVTGDARLSATGSSGGTVLIGTDALGGADLARSTVIADGASISVGGRAGGGSVETSGHAVSIGKAKVGAGQGGQWRIDPTDLTIDSAAAATIASSLNGGTNVTEQTTASTVTGSGVQSPGAGDINVSSPITWTGTGALTLSAYNNLNLNAGISGAGGLVGQAGSNISVNSNVSAANVALTAAGGNLTLGSGVTVTGGNGITLQTLGHFVNNSGANALSPGTGRWLVYSTDPSADTVGGLSAGFLQYAAPGGTTPATSGNGLLYSISPSLSVALSGTAAKLYDGTTVANLTSANAPVSGLINSDAAAVTGSYAGKNAGTGIGVTASSIAVTHSGVPVFGYAGTTPSVSANIGEIDPATVTASIIGTPTKTYNGTTTASLGSPNYQLNGFVSGEGASVNQPSSVAYDSPDAGTRTITAGFSPTNFVPTGGTNFANYNLPTTAAGPGLINQAPLLVSGVLGTNKTYDRTTSDGLNTTSAALYGIIGSDDVSLVTTGATGAFASPNVGSNLAVSASGLTLSGTKAPNYTLIQPSGLTANISPVTLSITGVNAMGKVYDSSSIAALNTASAALNGVISGDSVTLSTTSGAGAFATSDVGSAIPVTALGFSISGIPSSNYRLTQPSGLSADITARPLSASITANPTKVYNGDAGASVGASGFTLTGFAGSESATIGQTSHVAYDTLNAGTQGVTATLSVSDFTAGGGTKLSNYLLPTSASGTGSITPASISISITGNPTKTYDGNASASLASSNYSLSGFLTGQSATVNQPAGLYDSSNAGVRQVTASLTSLNFTAGSGTTLSNYAFPTTATGSGTIIPAPVMGGIYAAITGNPTKTYDGTTLATLTPLNFLLTGFSAGQGASVNQTIGQYGNKNVGVQALTASLTPSNFNPNSGTDLSNYSLPSIAYGSGTINPALLIASIIGAPTKVYNGTSTATLNPGNFSIAGLAPGEGVNIAAAVRAAYDARQAGSRTITANLATTDITPQSGTALSNYTLPTSATGPGQITDAPLSILDVAAQNKTYDTTTAASLLNGSAHLFGVVGSDSVALGTTGSSATFTSPNAGSSVPVAASGFTISGSDAGNYQLFQPVGLAATIYRAPLSIAGVSTSNKYYDNTNVAPLNTASATLSGVLSPDSGQVTLDGSNAAASFSAVNVGNNLSVSAGGFALNGTQAGNYALYQPSGLAANINQKPLTAVIVGNPTKVYDGSTSTTLTAANYNLLGFVSGQGASLPQSATAQYVAPSAGTQGIGSTLVSSDYLANNGTNLSNYVLPTTGSGTGTITQAPLFAAIIGNPTKTYDATTGATLAPGNYTLIGFVGSQGATITQTAGSYGAPGAGSQTVAATLGGGDFTPSGSTNLSNYALPTLAAGIGTINKAPLQVIGIAGTSRSYNGGTADTLNVSGAGVSGLIGSDSVTLNSAGATGVFASKDVGTGISVAGSGFTMAGGQTADYTLAQPVGLSADITQALLNVSKVSRVYDSTTGVPTIDSAYTLGGIFGSDAVSMNASGITGSYSDKNVGASKSVSLSGLALTGAQASDYNIAPTVTNASIGEITKAPLTVAGAMANNKVYDGNTVATLNNTSAALGGLYSGDSVTLDPTSAVGAFGNKNVGNSKAVTASGFTVSGGDAGNYAFTQPTGLTADITPNNGLNLASVTKIYDGGLTLPTGSGAYGLTGVLGSDSVQVATGGLAGGYGSPNVGSSLPISLTGLALTGTDAANYSIGSTVTGANIGTINPKTLSASIIGTPTKTYDATTAATLGTSNYSIAGFVTGEGATVTKTSGSYASPNAGTPNASTTLAAGDFAPTGGTLLSNYNLPISALGGGKINKAPLTITGVLATDKIYNRTVADPLNTASAALSGVVAADSGLVTLNSGSATGTFASPNIGTGIAVTAAGFGIGGSESSNYTLSQPTGLAANITQALLNLSSVTKVYDATPAATGAGVSYGLSGIVGPDVVSVDTTNLSGSYAAKNVGTGLSVSLSGLALTGSGAGNYSIGASVTNAAIGIITHAPLTVSGALGVGKVYDGTTTASLNNGSTALQGVLLSDVVNLTSPGSGTFSSSNAGTWAITPGSAYTISGTDAANYLLAQPTGFSATITHAPLAISIVGNPTRAYNSVTAATLAPANYSLTGFIGGQGATVTQTSGLYDVADAGARTVTATLSGANFTPTGGALLSNYLLPTVASGGGTINPQQLIASIIGNPTRVYDSTVAATLAPGNYSVTGFASGQGATVNQTAGTYDSANAGTRIISAALSAGNFAPNGGTNFSNYLLPTNASGAGTINKAPLTISIIGTPTRIYDGTLAALLSAGNYNLSGFIGSQGATISQTAGAYDSANAGSRTVTAALAAGNFSPTGGATLGNYTLPTIASGAGLINQKTLTATIVNNPTRVYDGTTNATLNSANYSLAGFVGGQGASVAQSSGIFDAPDAGARTATATLAAGNFTPTGGANLSNYVLPMGASGAGTINPKTLTASITGDPTRIYDGTNTAALAPTDYTLGGFIGGQGATVSQASGAFDSSHAGSRTVTAALSAGDFTSAGGANLTNYILPTTATGAGTINQKSVTALIIGNPTRVYNAGTSATLTPTDYMLGGFVGGQGATVTQGTGAYDSADAGSRTVAAILAAGNFTATGGATLSDYVLPTSAAGAGTINQKGLTATIIGNPTRTYDGMTTETLAPGNYLLGGFLASQGATVNQTAGIFDAPDAGSRTVAAVLSSGNFSPNGGTNLANYTLPGTASGAGTINPKGLNVAITGNPTRVYDGTPAATLASGDYTVNGFIGGQGATVSQPLGNYDSANAGSRTASATLAAGNFTPTGGANLSNYILPTTASGPGNINPKTLSAALVGDPTRTYDGTTLASLGSANYTLGGFLAGQGATVTQTAGTFDAPDAGSRTVTAGLGAGNFTPDGGTNLSNYALPVTASGAGIINPKTLTASITGNPTRAYDATTLAILTPGDYTLAGFIGAQGAAVTQATGNFDGTNVGSHNVSALLGGSYFAPNTGTSLANYFLPSTASGTGTITPRTLTAAITGNPTRVYDSTTAATLQPSDYTLNGFTSGQGATVNEAAGAYNSADAGGRSVTAPLLASVFTAGSGTDLRNYALPTSAAGAGTINPKALAAIITGMPGKTYDGTTVTALNASDYTLGGFIGHQGARVTETVGNYNAPDAGPRSITAVLGTGKFAANSDTNLNNYLLPAAASGVGTIFQKTLSASITGTPSKTYDDSTSVSLKAGDYTLTGFVGSQGAGVNQTSGTFDLADAGSRTVAAALSPGDFNANSGTNLANYALPNGASGPGIINPQTLIATITGNPTRIYNGTTNASLAPSNYSLAGFVGGQGGTVSEATGNYDRADAGSRQVTAALGTNSIVANDGTNLANYTLPTTAAGTGLINPKTLTATLTGTPVKPYDTTDRATLGANNYSITGFVPGQSAAVTQTVGTYANPNAGTQGVSTGLGTNDFIAGPGTSLSNYVLPSAAAGSGRIDPRTLNAIIAGATKTYDGSTSAMLAPSNWMLTGFAGTQGGTVTQTGGTYAAPDAGSHTVTASLLPQNFSLTNGALASNYILPSFASGTGLINPKPLTVAITGIPGKTYDGVTAALLDPSNYMVSGFLPGQGASVLQIAGKYDSPDAGTRTVRTALGAGNFVGTAGTNLGNYILPDSAAGPGIISGRPVTAVLVSIPAKMSDGSVVANLVPANFVLSGFLPGQGATVIQRVGSYDAAASGSHTVTTTLGNSLFSPLLGTQLSNYVLPTVASGQGLITPALNTNAATLTEAIISNATVRKLASAPAIAEAAAKALFASAVPRTYIPYPAPSTLSTWQNNGFGSLPTIVESSSALIRVSDTGDQSVSSGPPVINTTEEILLQGGKDKSWRISLPLTAPIKSSEATTPVKSSTVPSH